MRAWQVVRPGPLDGGPLVLADVPDPVPAEDELLVRVEACGVCRTDLHVAEGDLPVHRADVVPGHEAVGSVVAAGPAQRRFAPGDRVGVPWLRRTCGECAYCRAGRENLCPRSLYTGWDADGGYAELVTVPAAYAYALPPDRPAVELAPLLCAGIIGYRSLRVASLPPGGRLGIYGFGASAHLTAQVALAQGARVHVLTRGAGAQDLARELGVDSVAGAYDRPPEPLDSAIVFAPAGELVPVALEALDRGGTLALAGIHMSDVPTMSYGEHLFLEKTVRSVTANTRQDGEEFLRLAARLGVRVTTTAYALEEAARALADLSAGRVRGVACLDLS